MYFDNWQSPTAAKIVHFENKYFRQPLKENETVNISVEKKIILL